MVDSARRRSSRDVFTTFLYGGTQVAAQRGNCGRECHQNSCQKRDGHGPAEDSEIEANFIQARQGGRAEDANEANAPEGEHCANQSRKSSEHNAFGEKLSHYPSSTGSKRSADGHFSRAADA